MKPKEPKVIVTFETIADAMAMEKMCQERQISGRLIPIPRALSAGCGIVWQSEISEEERVSKLINLKNNGSEHIEGNIHIWTS